LIIKEETDFESFLEPNINSNLAIRHKVKPVHALNEIEYLKIDSQTISDNLMFTVKIK
jgi:hypothetical protein